MRFSKLSPEQEEFISTLYAREEEIRDKELIMFQNYLNQLYAENQDISSFDDFAKDMLTLQYIAYHTARMEPGVTTRQDRALIRAGLVGQFRKTEKGFKFNNWHGQEIDISKLSATKSIRKQFPYITDFAERSGHCHHDSMIIALMTGNRNSKVVTGNVTSLAPDHKIMHSWVEFLNKDGIERVADSTFNLIMNKEDYYRLRKAEPIAYLSSEEIIDDIYSGLLDSKPIKNIDYKAYLLYHDEILKDFKRYPRLYLKDESIFPQPQ